MSTRKQPDLSRIPTPDLKRALRRMWRQYSADIRGYYFNLAEPVGESITAITKELDRRAGESK